MKYFIFQGNEHDCGFTSLKMLMAHLLKDKSYLYVKKIRRKEAFSVEDICKEAGMHGLKLASYGCDEEYFDKIKSPSLTLIRNNHVVMVKKVTPKRIVYLDPEVGLVKAKKDEFIAIWCKIVIEVESMDCMSGVSKIRRSILPTRLKVLESITAIVSSAILIGVFYLLNNEQNAIFSLLFLLLFITAQIVENIVIHKEINFFDNEYIEPYFSRRSNQTKLSYLEFIGFKQNFFSNSRGLLSSVLIAFIVTFLLCLNDFRNIFVLLTLVLLKIMELTLFSKSLEEKRYQIGRYEEKCFESKEMCSDYAYKANALANQTVTSNKMKQLIYIAIAFAFALAMMLITGESGCNYVIFHFGLYYVGFTSFSQMLEALSNWKEMYRSECIFFDKCNL